jgi:hypothetical protein
MKNSDMVGIGCTCRTGSGKTCSGGDATGRLSRSGGLILTAKPEAMFMLQRLFAKAGRKTVLIGKDQKRSTS